MRRILSFVLVMTMVLGVSVYAFAHGGGFSQGHRNNYKNSNFNDELNLSNAQEEQLEDLQDKYYDQIEDLMDDMRDKNDDLRDLYFDKDADRDDIISAQKKVNSLRDKMFTLMTEMQLEMRDALTAEQLESMEDYGMMGFGMMNGFGMMGGRGFRGHMGGRGMMGGGHMMHGNGMRGW
ncbi:Spy/CpxP family protein refolding chaperone [Orenia metallireducens]|uniref:Protein refolding chaperone Spy/CpxP family n=1 Tax=Orenia metallireducens TaxID=1413210 RepID=A0A285IEN8_9FIRM|nr:Spy/CpxP family protein refolding chaperone [Orenia metallireducens]PRX19228.1 Spy/CpxP family protein refolding chaperone [Orenia metallireducens]SNY46257.1 protein refolding chaperone Spy/CpxP family [Orenia metallireducens]